MHKSHILWCGRKSFLPVVLLIVCLLPCSSFATKAAPQSVNILNLKQATEKTLAHNPQLYRYSFINEALTAQKQLSALRPSLNLEVELENFTGSGKFRNAGGSEATIALSSVVELGGKRSARESLAEARVNLALWEQQAETLDVLGKMTAIYIEGLVTQENIVLADKSLSLTKSLLRSVEKRALRGLAPEAEVMRAKAAVAQAEIRLSALMQRFGRQKIHLARYWGETTPKFEQLEGNLFEFGSSGDFEKLYIRVQNSPAIKVFASETRIKDAEVTLARANNRSDLTWRAGIKRFEETGDSALTASISMPLFSKKRRSEGVRSALAERNTVAYSKQDFLLRLHAKLYEAWSLRQQNIEAIRKTQEITLPALEKALRLTRLSYESGRYRYLDLVTAQEGLLTAKQSLIDSASNVLLSQALIEQLTNEALTQ